MCNNETNLIQNLAELRQLAQFYKVQPDHVCDPLGWLRRTCFQVKGSPSLNERLELLILDSVALKRDFERQKESEEELVVLIKTTAGVTEHLKSQIVNDILNPLTGNWRLFRPEERK